MSVRRRRLRVVALAVLAAVLVWLVADPLLGHRLGITDGEQTLDLGAAPVGVVALLASLSGWGLLAALERFGVRRAHAIWTAVAGAVLTVSFLPFIGNGIASGTRVSLALMHLAVAAVLVPGLGGTSPGARADAIGGDRPHQVRREQHQMEAVCRAVGPDTCADWAVREVCVPGRGRGRRLVDADRAAAAATAGAVTAGSPVDDRL